MRSTLITSWFALVFFIHWTADRPASCQPSLSPLERIQHSIDISSESAYRGRFHYSKQTPDGMWSVSGEAVRLGNGDKLVNVNTPEILEGIRVIQMDSAIWATSIDDPDHQEEIDQNIKPIAWYWVFRNGETLSFDNIDLLAENYRIRPRRSEFVAERETVPLQITSQYRFRPKAHLWVDLENGRQLKYERFNPDSELMESFEFFEVETIADDDKPGNWDLKGMVKIIDTDVSDDDVPEELKPLIQLYEPKSLPPGFVFRNHSTWDGRFGRVTRLLYSDGMALLSLYQRQLREDDQVDPPETESVGQRDKKFPIKMVMRHGRAVYIRDIDEVRISAVGDTDRCEIIDTLTSLEPMKSPLPDDLTAWR